MSLQKYAGSDLNIISDKLQKYLDDRALQGGQIVKYRLLNGLINRDPNRGPGDDFLFPSSMVIHLRGRLIDPGTNKAIEIGCVQNFNDITKIPNFKYRIFSPKKGENGEFMIRHGDIDEMESYECLELHEENGSNPYRDTSKPPIFERIDDISESQSRSRRRNYLFDSLTALRGATYAEMRIIGAGFGLNTQLPLEVLRDRLEGIAEKEPKNFYEAMDNADNKTKAVITMAREAEIIAFIPHENKWVFTGSNELITLLDRKEGMTELDQFANFIKNNKNGDQIKGNLTRMLAAKKEEKTKK